MALRNLLVRIGADISGLTKGMDNATKKLNKFNNNVGASMKGLQGRLGGALAGIGAGFFIKGGIEDAIRYEALIGTLGESLGANVEDFKKWQNEIGSQMGYSKLQGADLANTLSLNFKKIAVDQKDLVDKTTTMMEMAAVVANKRGMAMTEVSDRIRSAMNQEADGADELGVNVRVAAIEQSNAYKMMGASGPWDKLSENMRKTILYHHILEQVGQNLGHSLADNTQIRLAGFNAALGDTKMALGQAFLPIIYTVLPVLTNLMRHLERAMQYVAAFMRALFGIKTPFGTTNTSLNDQAGAANSAADAMGNLGDATEEAGKKAKKAAEKAGQGLQSFDEVHLLAEQAADTGSGGGGGGGVGTGALPEPPTIPSTPFENSIYDTISDSINKAVEKLKEFFKTSEGWATMVEGAQSIKKGFEDIANSKGLQLFIKAFKEDLPMFFDDLLMIGGGALKTIGGMLEIIAGALDGDGMKAWEGMGGAISGVYDIFTGTVGLIFPDLGRQLRKFGDDFDVTWKWVGEEFVKGSSGWGEFFDKQIIMMVTNIKKNWGEMKKENKSSFETMKKDMGANITEGIVNAVKKYYEFKDTMNAIKEHNSIIWGIIKEVIRNKAQEAWEAFKAPFAPLVSWFNTNVKIPFNNMLNGLGSGSGNAFSTSLKNTYNKIADRINSMLRGISGLGVAGMFPFSGISRYEIPKLAKGGIATGPTLAIVGEGREDEAIAPISKLQGYVTNAVMDAMKFNGGGGTGSGDIILNIDGRSFARIVKPHLEKENKRVGANVKLNPI